MTSVIGEILSRDRLRKAEVQGWSYWEGDGLMLWGSDVDLCNQGSVGDVPSANSAAFFSQSRNLEISRTKFGHFVYLVHRPSSRPVARAL